MPKITFIGAGSTIFAKNILGDSMLVEELHDATIALYDIDRKRLEESRLVIESLNAGVNENRATIETYCGTDQRRDALRDADYVVNAIQVGGYRPSTVIDFEIPKKYGLRQTIGDTMGIGGIFRGLRTIPVMLAVAEDIQAVCPQAWLLNYTNPMGAVTGAVLRGSDVRGVGLCHSVPGLARGLLRCAEMTDEVSDLRWRAAGINHQCWLLEIRDGEKDLYPEIKRRVSEAMRRVRDAGGARKFFQQAKAAAGMEHKRYWGGKGDVSVAKEMVRLELLLRLGYFATEGSIHTAEYGPWFIKSDHPGLLEDYNIPLDEYLDRCEEQIRGWEARRDHLTNAPELDHKRSGEYGSYIMEAMETDRPYRIHGNVLNGDLIPNLPANACVEVPCMVDKTGVNPCVVGDLPEVCAAVNRTNVNVQLMTIEAAFNRSRDAVYQAAMLDPHTGAELTIDQIVSMCDEMIEAHGDYLPELA